MSIMLYPCMFCCCHLNGSNYNIHRVFDTITELLDEVGVFVIVCGWTCSTA